MTPTPHLIGMLPESVLHSQWFAVLATLVALNTLAYVALAGVKLLPAVHPGDWLHRRERRREDRSIHPDAIVVRGEGTASSLADPPQTPEPAVEPGGFRA